MSKRVYEIAKELNLDNKEVIRRLNEAGVEVKHHSASIEDPDYRRVFESKPQAASGNGGAKSAKSDSGRGERSAPGNGGRKRRRVVIDASATSGPSASGGRDNRGGRGRSGGGSGGAQQPKPSKPEAPAEPQVVKVEPGATVADVAQALGVAPARVVKILFDMGEMRTQTQTLSADEIELIAEELGTKVQVAAEEPVVDEATFEDAEEDLVEKAPVVTVMGHVDHGKTSLLDRIRRADVQSGEAGGITQHIGAYQVTNEDGRKVTFIDTPGHEAFTEMRARGARVTDVVVLVVAADDGIMPQTDEAIEHSRAAGVPVVVAVNKIDVPNANVDRTLGELSERGLIPEVYGGETVTVQVSAKTGEGIDELLENILVVAELEDLKANPNAEASGYVIESERDPGRGPVATLLLSRGTLHKGDVVLAGTAYGRVRAMLDYNGKRIESAGPATPVEILGLSGVPEAGTRFEVVKHERIARSKAQQAEEALRRQELAEGGQRLTLDQLLGQEGSSDLNLVVKADVAGSVEALKESLAKLSNDEVRVNVVRSGVGAITDSDVMLASASSGILLGFNVRPTNTAKQVAEREGVEIRTYDVIYKALEEIEDAMRGMLAPEEREEETGTAEVRELFRVPNVGVVAGCYVTSGEISRNDRVRVVRDGTVVYDGNIASLRRFKDDVRSVREGFECGVGVENFNDLKQGDVLEFFRVVEVAR
ncbi:IF-2: translation initiation factor IF-2 [Rubrobacter radiotolerans]|uniref:Translation initiation factor IF-2 n=1 Tax=Rubrobacter radiotolerans TaxID=42256 RepID=A0A023X3S2_RUBRA|nr:translation initiation factor IF-2 [Rubrobacter radiotolerans]AHY46699.1 IF-2: translation initiation factor IF-2 [Rubrobacter radiotolerans]MDX5894106.1 translation initiation factor IF-2 [Rubrobacter radiotolerans]SMC05211.1 translation initiation factor IF-2 [Rubrobacter radiotolerans DSM 5868]